jgi:hypothetical protein
MTVHPHTDFLAKMMGVNTQHCFVIHNFILHLFHHELISSIKAHTSMLFATADLIVCLPMTQEARVRSSPSSFLFPFKHHVYNGFGNHNFLLSFHILALFLLSFYVLSHSRMTGMHVVSQRERLKRQQYFTTVKLYTLSE